MNDPGTPFLADQCRKNENSTVLAAVRLLQELRCVMGPKVVRSRAVLKHTVTDVNWLPTSLVIVTPNHAEIQRRYCDGYKEGDELPLIDGILFEVDRIPL
jgi:hypothetical protein